MPVTTTASHGFTSGAATSLTISHLSDANPLYVLLTWFVTGGGSDASNAVSGITYNGAALTLGGHSAVLGNTMEWWRLDAPSVGTANLVITLGSARRISAGVVNLSGWPSVIGDHEFATTGNSGLPPPPVTVNSRLGADVLSWIGFNDPTQDVTEPSGSTLLWNEELTGGGSGGGGDQVSAASRSDGSYPTVTLSWDGTVGAEYFGVAALSFRAGGGDSSRNLLTGESHAVTGNDNLLAGSGNAVTGDTSEAHGVDGTVVGTRSVLFSQDGSPHTLSADGTVSIYANDVLFNGTSVKNAITALTGDVTAAGPGSVAATIANDAVTNAKAANMSAATIKGRAVGAGTGDPTDLTGTQATAILDNVVGDSGSGGTKGLVPAPGAGDAAAGKFLKADGTFAVPSGSGSVSTTGSPASGNLAKFSGASSITNGDLSGDVTTSGTLSTTLKTAAKTRDITFAIDGGGSALTTGIKADVNVDYACTITQVTMLADQSGSAVVDIWKDTYANYPPTGADSITASAKPTITTATKSQDSTLTGWTVSISAGDTLRFNIDSASTITRLNLTLKVTV